MKRILSLIITIMLLSSTLPVFCVAEKNDNTIELDQIRRICSLATVDCYFKNIAKSTTTDDHFYTKDSDFVFTYSGSVKVGLASGVSAQQDDNTITITLPPVEMIDVSVSYPDEKSIIRTSSGLLYADVSSEDITKAIENEKVHIIRAVSNNNTILESVLSKAKLLCTCQQKLDTQILRLDMGKRNYGQGMRKPVQAIRHLLTEPERNAGHKCRR